MTEPKSGWGRLWRWGLSLTAWGFMAVGGVCFLLVALMIWKGDRWTHFIYAEKPIPHVLGGLAALFVWYSLLFGIHNTRQEWKRFAGRMALLAFSVAFSFVAGEVAFRAFHSAQQRKACSLSDLRTLRKEGKTPPVVSTHPLATIIQPSDNLKVAYELRPNLDKEFGHRRVRTNSDGMRESREYSRERIPGSVRIIGIGDSGMFGWNMEQDDDYMAVLETRLAARRDGGQYEVLNLAVPGYNTQLEVEMLAYKGLAYQPDIAVVGWCNNDFSLPMFLLEKENYWRTDKCFLYDLLFRRVRRVTSVTSGVTLRDLRDYNKDKVMPEIQAGTDTEGVRWALLQLKAMGEEHGFKILVFGPLKPRIRELCTAVGLPMADTLALMPAGKYPREYGVHYMHPSKDGHRVLAECLENELDRRGWLAAPRPSE